MEDKEKLYTEDVNHIIIDVIDVITKDLQNHGFKLTNELDNLIFDFLQIELEKRYGYGIYKHQM